MRSSTCMCARKGARERGAANAQRRAWARARDLVPVSRRGCVRTQPHAWMPPASRALTRLQRIPDDAVALLLFQVGNHANTAVVLFQVGVVQSLCLRQAREGLLHGRLQERRALISKGRAGVPEPRGRGAAAQRHGGAGSRRRGGDGAHLAPEHSAQPDGHKVVPGEPTTKTLASGARAAGGCPHACQHQHTRTRRRQSRRASQASLVSPASAAPEDDSPRC
jgi:hypothetical protein